MIAAATMSLLLFQGPLSISNGQVLNPGHLPKPGQYISTCPDDHAAWVIRGKDLVIDLSGRKLRGYGIGPKGSGRPFAQSGQTGSGILLDHCANVTLKNADVSGFRTDIVLRNCTGVKIAGCAANKSRAIRMEWRDKPVDTDLALRDIQAWRDYGAGIWLEGCSKCLLEHDTATQAQNGVVLVGCSHCNLVAVDCSYNGGWGFALWGGDRNTLAWNHADFCNRPWHGGWGGNAAGILVVNNSIANQFIANSVTHCADGMIITDRLNGGYNTTRQTYDLRTASNFSFVGHNDASWSTNDAIQESYAIGAVFYSNMVDNSTSGIALHMSDDNFLTMNSVLRNKWDGIDIANSERVTLYRNEVIGNQNADVHIWGDTGPVQLVHPSQNTNVFENQLFDSKNAVLIENSFTAAIEGNTVQHAGLAPGINRRMESFADSRRLAAWVHSGTARRLDGWFAERPKGWKFYRELSLPTGPAAIHPGEFAPIAP